MNSPQLRQLAHLAIAAQIFLATLLLALGEASGLLLFTTVVVLSLSAVVTDWKRVFALNQRSADLMALGVMALSTVAALRTDREGLLPIVGNLQSYLQYVLLFQRKSTRIYWQLSLLSLGQMAIASTLIPDPSFGIVLVGQLLFGFLAFGLLLLANESESVTQVAGGTFALSAAGSASGARIAVSGSAPPFDRFWLWKSLVPVAVLSVCVTMAVATPMFLALPRWGVSNFESTDTEPLRTVGFAETVMLGELGGAVDNPELVMRISFYRGRGDTPMRLTGEPLFRGNVLTRYEDRIWSQPTASHPTSVPTKAGSTITRQRISIEPLDVAEVFHVAPIVAIDDSDQRLKLNPQTGRLYRQEEYRLRTLEFDLGTTGIRGDRQRTILPSLRYPREVQTLLQPFSDGAGAEEFPEITALATQILEDQNIDPKTNRRRAAQALSDYFHLSGEYFYSLEGQKRDESIDPLEDFVSVNHAGHCEYYAGALVMMLRSQGIPARMVVGFKGGEWNDVGKYYQVQQLHAHAWVEALLEGDQLPVAEFAGEDIPEAAWLVLDPTEGTQEYSTVGQAGLIARIRQAIDYGRVLWINYFASLNAKRQRQGIYEPLAAGIEAGADNLTSVETWQNRLRAIEQSPVGAFWLWYKRHWFSWRGGLVAAGFSAAIVSLVLGARAAWQVVRKHGWLGASRPQEDTPVFEIYRRLEAALIERGLRRRPAQTAREFALAAGGELAETVEYRELAPLPDRIVAAFYAMRFGGRVLDAREEAEVEAALNELEHSLKRSRS